MEQYHSASEFLIDHARSGAVSFHMPGHKGADLYRRLGYGEFLQRLADCDVTEIPGADNLFQTEGILKAVQDRYAALYGAERSYLLVNGTSGGILASILACVPQGGKLIMARNCHKAVFNALALAGGQPVYAYPELLSEYGISGEIPPGEIEACLDANPDAAAVILPSPNYYGVCSDIEAIAEAVHDRGKVLIVDQAHGAHLHFFRKLAARGSGLETPCSVWPLSAEEAGADIAINSIHKTLGSFTQSAVLNLLSGKVDRYVLEDKLQAVQTTSPSYLLMGSLDIAADMLEKRGTELMGDWNENLQYFYGEVRRRQNRSPQSCFNRIKVLDDINDLDRSKINLDTSGLSLTASQVEQQLMDRGIFAELTTGNILMLMTGIGNTRAHFDRLLSALEEICRQAPGNAAGADCKIKAEGETGACGQTAVLQTRRAPLEPIPLKKRRVPLEEAAGLVCASSIIPYPPGIPLICPGERLTAAHVAAVRALRACGEKVIGVGDDGRITVGAGAGEE